MSYAIENLLKMCQGIKKQNGIIDQNYYDKTTRKGYKKWYSILIDTIFLIILEKITKI